MNENRLFLKNCMNAWQKIALICSNLVSKSSSLNYVTFRLFKKEKRWREKIDQLEKVAKINSRHIKAEADGSTNHDYCIHDVPKFSQITTRMQYDT